DFSEASTLLRPKEPRRKSEIVCETLCHKEERGKSEGISLLLEVEGEEVSLRFPIERGVFYLRIQSQFLL
ncbi:MAG: hypothetical protein B6U86_01300, partial [Candidatus Altiarchaeales archaeon ex4484_43]